MNFLLVFANTSKNQSNIKFKARALLNQKKILHSNRLRKSSSCENSMNWFHGQSTSEIKINEDEYSVEYEKFKQKYPWQGLNIPENVDKSLEKVFMHF
jgi:hypothetical protein